MKQRMPCYFQWVVFGSVAVACFNHEVAADDRKFRNVACGGTYRHHLQGLCTDGKSHLFWCFTTTLVKTDSEGRVRKTISVKNHHGDLCFHSGKLFVAVNFGKFNDPKGNADSWVYVYRANDLSLISKHKTPEVVYGAGGIGYRKGHFFVVGGLPNDVAVNFVYEYDRKFQFLKRHVIRSGHTRLGIQTATFAAGRWWFGCYGSPKILLTTNADFRDVRRFSLDCSLGVVGLSKKTFLVGKGTCSKQKGCTGRAAIATAETKKGLVVRKPN